MVALLGISALTLDTSYVFAKRNQLHAAADAAAKSGAIEIVRNASVGEPALEQLVLPLGPVRLYLDRAGAPSVRAKIDLNKLI